MAVLNITYVFIMFIFGIRVALYSVTANQRSQTNEIQWIEKPDYIPFQSRY